MAVRKPGLPIATFPQRLRTMMVTNGLSQSDIARQVGYTPTAIWNWLQGNTLPRPETLTALANLLDVTEDWLRDGDVLVTDGDTVDDGFADSENIAEQETIAEKVDRLRAEIAALTGYHQSRVRLTLEFGSN